MIVLLLAACIPADHDGDGRVGSRDCAPGDPELPEMRWIDADGDGVGSGRAELVCERAGTVPMGGAIDCDDADPAAFPAAPERCNGRDDDCDGRVDEAVVDAVAGWIDEDGDGYGGLPGWDCRDFQVVGRGGDCHDRRAYVHPGASDVCDGRNDDDCDGLDAAMPGELWWPDLDLDGWGDSEGTAIDLCSPGPGWARTVGDCDDADPGKHPDLRWWFDDDGDGYGGASAVIGCAPPSGAVAVSGDCDDADPDAYPGAVERCGDRVDQDCDGRIDEAVPWWPDADADGWGVAGPYEERCEALPGWAAAAGDCDDADPSVSPGAADRVGEAVDRDCDGRHAPPLEPVAWVEARPVWSGARGAALGDLDADGLADVAVYDEAYVSVILGGRAERSLLDGDLLVRARSAFGGLSIVAGDLVGDPTPDLVVGDAEHHEVRVYDGARRGWLAEDGADAVLSDWGAHSVGATVAPYGPGRLAVAARYFDSSPASVHLIQGPVSGWAAVADAPTRILAPDGSTDFLLGDEDFDGDGLPDLLGAGGPSIWLVTDPPTGEAYVEDSGELWEHSSWHEGYASAGDIDGDGLPELVWREAAGVQLWSPAAGAMSLVEGGVTGFTAAGDVDGNGRAELIVAAEEGVLRAIEPPASGVWSLDDVTVRAGRLPSGVEPGYGLVGVGDADGDGRGEVMVRVEGDAIGWLLVSP